MIAAEVIHKNDLYIFSFAEELNNLENQDNYKAGTRFKHANC